MSDYTDLQKAAEYAAQDTIKFADEDEEMRALQQFHEEVNPETVLALIAENDRLNAENKQLIALECHGGTAEAAINLLAERDQLKAENEALLKALDVAAARMLAAKVCFDRDYPGEWSGELHLAVAIKEIDAAMGKGELS